MFGGLAGQPVTRSGQPEHDPFIWRVDGLAGWRVKNFNPNPFIFVSGSCRVSCRVENCHP